MIQQPLQFPDTVNEQVAEIEAQIAALKDKIAEVQRSRLLVCHHCRGQSVISTLTYIQTFYYVSPRGCSGGDYYMPSEGRYTCPRCGELNRLQKFQGHEGVDKLKPYFGAVVDED